MSNKKMNTIIFFSLLFSTQAVCVDEQKKVVCLKPSNGDNKPMSTHHEIKVIKTFNIPSHRNAKI